MKARTVTLALCAGLIAPGALTGARAAQQRVNPNSNTERGGLEVKQVPGRKIGNITTRGNLRPARARCGGDPVIAAFMKLRITAHAT